MQTIMISPKNIAEYNLITALLEKMNIQNASLELSDEEKEDLGLAILMQEADNNDTVSREEIMAKLRKPKQVALA